MVCLGAGSITAWANALPGQLQRLLGEETRGVSLICSPALPPVRGRYRAGVPLAPRTWLRVGGPAEVVFQPADAADLAIFLAGKPAEVAVTPIGVASNLLVRDGGLEGVVLRFAGPLAEVDVEDERLRVGAGATDRMIAIQALKAGLSGLEFLIGIPGTLGGAVRMNAGAFGGETAEVVERVVALDPDGPAHELGAAELGFGYRHSACRRTGS